MTGNLPDDWGNYYGPRCERCGYLTHASENYGCGCGEREELAEEENRAEAQEAEAAKYEENTWRGVCHFCDLEADLWEGVCAPCLESITERSGDR